MGRPDDAVMVIPEEQSGPVSEMHLEDGKEQNEIQSVLDPEEEEELHEVDARVGAPMGCVGPVEDSVEADCESDWAAKEPEVDAGAKPGSGDPEPQCDVPPEQPWTWVKHPRFPPGRMLAPAVEGRPGPE